jgi:hypothetical protein
MLSHALPFELRHLAMFELLQPSSLKELPHRDLLESIRMCKDMPILLVGHLVLVRPRHLIDNKEHASGPEEMRESGGGLCEGFDMMVSHATLNDSQWLI